MDAMPVFLTAAARSGRTGDGTNTRGLFARRPEIVDPLRNPRDAPADRARPGQTVYQLFRFWSELSIPQPMCPKKFISI
jgi:hypothetical protein